MLKRAQELYDVPHVTLLEVLYLALKVAVVVLNWHHLHRNDLVVHVVQRLEDFAERPAAASTTVRASARISAVHRPAVVAGGKTRLLPFSQHLEQCEERDVGRV